MMVVALVLATAVVAFVLSAPARGIPANVSRMPIASVSSRLVPQIGALYGSAGDPYHGCTASVVHSPHGNTLITAAHCAVASGAGMVFAPGQRGASMPFGLWTVTAAYIEPEWKSRQAQHADVAFLTVAPRIINGRRTEIEQVTGAYQLGSAARSGQRVTVTGYPGGGANYPITCAVSVYMAQGFPSFDCRGFVDGTSGSPWLRVTRHGSQIVGVIGGLNQGGCYDYTSYSSPLATDVDDVYARAMRGAPADVAPQPGGNGC
jgi:V8-like Glu-specific endopeptidase